MNSIIKQLDEKLFANLISCENGNIEIFDEIFKYNIVFEKFYKPLPYLLIKVIIYHENEKILEDEFQYNQYMLLPTIKCEFKNEFLIMKMNALENLKDMK